MSNSCFKFGRKNDRLKEKQDMERVEEVIEIFPKIHFFENTSEQCICEITERHYVSNEECYEYVEYCYLNDTVDLGPIYNFIEKGDVIELQTGEDYFIQHNTKKDTWRIVSEKNSIIMELYRCEEIISQAHKQINLSAYFGNIYHA